MKLGKRTIKLKNHKKKGNIESFKKTLKEKSKDEELINLINNKREDKD